MAEDGATRPTVLVFDSGVGGLTVVGELRKAMPRARLIFVADNEAFPYGTWQEEALVAHIVALFRRLLAVHAPDVCVIACNTASTLVLPALRENFPVPFVGTVRAIKPAATETRTGLISVLATPGTVKRDYTKALIAEFASNCEVNLVASSRLAGLAEAKFAGNAVDLEDIRAEIEPAFVARHLKRTDVIVLACTHYPLLMDELREAAPWPVEWIDPTDAIARRAAHLWAGNAPVAERPEGDGEDLAIFTAPEWVTGELRAGLKRYGFAHVEGIAACAER